MSTYKPVPPLVPRFQLGFGADGVEPYAGPICTTSRSRQSTARELVPQKVDIDVRLGSVRSSQDDMLSSLGKSLTSSRKAEEEMFAVARHRMSLDLTNMRLTELTSDVLRTALIRRVGLPESIYGMAVAALADSVYGPLDIVGIFLTVVLNNFVQGFLSYYLYHLSTEILGSGRGCACRRSLQWICIFVFVLIMWEEISTTLELLELIAFAPGEGALESAPSAMSTARSPLSRSARSEERPRADPHDPWEDTDDQDWVECAAGEDRTDDGWCLCDCAKAGTDEAKLLERQFTGFRVQLTIRQRWILRLIVAIPKLLMEIALLVVGGIYIAASLNDEGVVISVVAVTYITEIDELFLNSLVSNRARQAIRQAPRIRYHPEECPGRIWVRCRTKWKLLIDLVACVVVTECLLAIALGHMGCERWRATTAS